MRSCLMVVLLALPLAGLAGTAVYRSVDAEGRVSFSDRPPADAKAVEAVPLPPVPSEAELAAARERARQELAVGREVTDRMAEERRHRERLQVERERWQPTRPAEAPKADRDEPPAWIVWPAYGRPGHGMNRYRPYPPYRPHPGWSGSAPHSPRKPQPPTPLRPGFSVEWHKH